MKDLLKINFVYKDQFEQVIKYYNLDDPLKLADLVAGMSTAPRKDLQEVLTAQHAVDRLQKVLMIMKQDLENARLQTQFRSQIEDKFAKENKKYILMQQLRHIKRELNLERDDKQTIIAAFKESIEKLGDTVPEEANKAIAEMHEKPMGEKKLTVKLSDYQQGTSKDKDDGKGKAKGKGKTEGAKGQGKAKGKAGTPQASGYPYTQYPYNYGYAYGGMPVISAEALQLQGFTPEQIEQAQAQYLSYMLQAQAAQAFYSGYSGMQFPTTPAPPADDKASDDKGKKKGDAAKDAKPPPDPSKEFEGHIKSISEKNGYGFISCPETKSVYERDVFVDLAILPQGTGINDKVKFTVALSEKGHPRALNVKAA